MDHKENIDMAIDQFDKVMNLLHIVEKCAGHGNRFSSIAASATAELQELNEKLRVEALKKSEADAKVKADADAKIAAKQKAEAEAAENNPVRTPQSVAQREMIERRQEQAKQAEAQELAERPNVRPSVYPQDSETATIADRRV